MLRNRSRAVTSKQAIMSEHGPNFPSPTQNLKKPISSFLGSPRFFFGHDSMAKTLFEPEAVMSPTSILDKQFSVLTAAVSNPFAFDKKPSFRNSNKHLENKDGLECSEAIGLAFIDSLNNEKRGDDRDDDGVGGEAHSRSNTRMVLFGSKLKIQIPPNQSPSDETPKSPADFGIKTPNSQKLATLSALKSANTGGKTTESPRSAAAVPRQLSLSEMELLEEYTCVISHGPNPKTTHIYDNCIVESCCGVVRMSKLRNVNGSSPYYSGSPSNNFLGSCYRCKKVLGDGKDIYMLRGEKAFCSHECRCQEMLLDGMENPEPTGESRTRCSNP